METINACQDLFYLLFVILFIVVLIGLGKLLQSSKRIEHTICSDGDDFDKIE